MKIISRGSETTVVTGRGTEVEVRYLIVELASLIASHDVRLKIDPRYPVILQPRDRERMASEQQVTLIQRALRPDLLAASALACDGAPIIGPDFIVESGNARVIALRRVYELGTATAYRKYLQKHAGLFGINPGLLKKTKEPVLVRLRLTETSRWKFVRECNEQSVAALSASEQARIDADNLDNDVLSLFLPDEANNLASAANRPFVRAFLDRAVAPSERGRYMDQQGFISQEGIRRIQNALCAKAYGDPSTIERLAEATDDNVRRISQALLKQSAAFASLNLAIKAGARHPYDLTPHVARATRKLSALRDAGQTVGDFLIQHVLCGEDLSPLERRILAVFEERKLSSRSLDDVLLIFIDLVDALGHPGQASLTPLVLPSIEELFETAASAPKRIAPARVSKGTNGGTWDRAAAAQRAWITIRAKRGLSVPAAKPVKVKQPKAKAPAPAHDRVAAAKLAWIKIRANRVAKAKAA